MHTRSLSFAIATALVLSVAPMTSFAQSLQAISATNAHTQGQVQAVTQISTQVRPSTAMPGAVGPAAPVVTTTQAVSNLQQSVGSTGSSVPGSSVDFGSADESTLIREMSRQQARLAFIQMMAKIEKAKLEIERDKFKFEEEMMQAKAKAETAKAEAKSAAAGGLLPGGVAGAPGVGMPLPPPGASIPMPASVPLPGLPGGTGSAVDLMNESSKPSVRSIYSFDGKYFAEVVTNGSKTIAQSGTSLPNGDKVLSVSSSGVTISRKGKRVVLGVEMAASSDIKP